MPTDYFKEYGVTRQGSPFVQMFGAQELPGEMSPIYQQEVQDQRLREAAQKKLDLEFANIDRQIQAENAADEYIAQNPEARMAGSQRFGDIARMEYLQQRGPSYSDQVLSRQLANKLNPMARTKFYGYLEQGIGANAAFDEAQADEEDMKARADLVESGLPLERLKEFEGKRIDPLTAASLRAGLKRQTDPEGLSDMNDLVSSLRESMRDIEKRNGNMVPLPQDPEYADYTDILSKLKEVESRKNSILQNRIFGTPAPTANGAPTVAAGGAVAPAAAPVAAPAGQSFKETMKQLNVPKVEDILKVTDEEVVQDINNPAADENTFTTAITDPNTSLETKKQALEKLKSFSTNPPVTPGLTVGETIRRREQLKGLYEDMKKEVEFQPVLKEYNKVWTEAKDDMQKLLEGFAKNLGVTKDSVEASLVNDERIKGIPGYERADVDEGGVTVNRLFSDYIADAMNQKRPAGGMKPGLAAVDPRFERFKDSPFASKLGQSSFLGIGGQRTLQDVLDAYLIEKAKAPAAAAAPKSANIKSITPIP